MLVYPSIPSANDNQSLLRKINVAVLRANLVNHPLTVIMACWEDWEAPKPSMEVFFIGTSRNGPFSTAILCYGVC